MRGFWRCEASGRVRSAQTTEREIMSRPVRSPVTREADECSLVLLVDKGSRDDLIGALEEDRECREVEDCARAK